MKQSTEYLEVSRSNAIFGGVKVLQMIVSFMRTKIVAIFLGPSGIGILSLLDNMINTIYNFTNLGIAQSGVRTIAIEKDNSGKLEASRIIEILSFILGAGAAILCFLFSSIISLWVFGDSTHKTSIQIVSIAILFISQQNGQIALFQGYHAVKALAVASLFASIAMFSVTVPFLFCGGESSIPYIIVCSYGAGALVLFLFRLRNLPLWKKMELRNSLKSSKPTISLGVALMLSNSLMSVFLLLLNSLINRIGSSEDVGLYQAANTCTYVAITILISILSADFYPRISSAAGDVTKVGALLSAQVELLILILVPVVFSMVLFPNFYVLIFYSNSFLSAVDAVRLMGISLLFRIIWHSYSYIILSQGDKVVYFFCDALIGNGLFFLGNLLGYVQSGILGIALSYVVLSFIIMLFLGTIVKVKYKVSLNSQVVVRVFSLICISVAFYFIVYFKLGDIYIHLPLFCIVACYCLRLYNIHTNMFTVLRERIWKLRK